jgi:hypothetical protein
MEPAPLDQNARKKIRILEKTIAKFAFGLGGLCQETDIRKVLELCTALDGASEISPPDKSTMESWLRAFLEADLPSKLLGLAVFTIRIAFPASSPTIAAAPVHKHVLLAWKAAHYLLVQVVVQLASKPSPPKELVREFLDRLLPTNHGGASKSLSDYHLPWISL